MQTSFSAPVSFPTIKGRCSLLILDPVSFLGWRGRWSLVLNTPEPSLAPECTYRLHSAPESLELHWDAPTSSIVHQNHLNISRVHRRLLEPDPECQNAETWLLCTALGLLASWITVHAEFELCMYCTWFSSSWNTKQDISNTSMTSKTLKQTWLWHIIKTKRYLNPTGFSLILLLL